MYRLYYKSNQAGCIMKKRILLTFVSLLAGAGLCFSACSGYDGGYGGRGEIFYPSADGNANGGNYQYGDIIEQDFCDVSESPSSYFSLDRNTASYSLVRSQIENGLTIAPDSVRIEELINYFDYSFGGPVDEAVSVGGYLSACPWNEENSLMLAGVKTKDFDLSQTNGNYIFLIDVSGSMSGDARLGLAKKGLYMLLDNLTDSDVVSIVTYASGVKTVADGGECTQSGKEQLKSKIAKLSAHGATSGGDGLERAYNIAQKHFITGGNNRVIIISDGDFNVGISDLDELKEFIQIKADGGVFLSAIGVGLGNMRDDLMETLARNGNGNYAYLDSEYEAKKVFVDELNGTLKTVAKDAKASVTFTENVEKYRLIGYDTKLISADDFQNEDTDAGEIGSGLCVTALYEIKLKEDAEKIADIEVRYKDADAEEKQQSKKVEVTASTPSCEDLSFISCVAEFGLVLRKSKYRGEADLENVLERLESMDAYLSDDEYKTQFCELVKKVIATGFYG